MCDHFVDTYKSPEIISEFALADTPEKAIEVLNKYLPNWFIGTMVEYSPDYRILQTNWEKVCKLLSVFPKHIVIVADLKFDDEHKTTTAISEKMTRQGYCVRREGELIPCTVCSRAIPHKEIWKILRSRYSDAVPPEWSDTCKVCRT